MDYLYIGSNGFAQVGQPDFHWKNKAEMAVLLEYLETQQTIPEEFAGMCCYRIKWFRHDFGNYSEIVLLYDDRILERWESNDPDRFDRFWKWLYQVETADLSSESLTREIASCYAKMMENSELKPLSHD